MIDPIAAYVAIAALTLLCAVAFVTRARRAADIAWWESKTPEEQAEIQAIIQGERERGTIR